MKPIRTSAVRRTGAVLLAALSCLFFVIRAVPSQAANGWFPPRVLPAGVEHQFWTIGMSGRSLVKLDAVRSMSDGSHIFVFEANNPNGKIYIWDRISGDYNSPAVASTDPQFRTFTSLSRNNPVFVEKIASQLRYMWGDHPMGVNRLLKNKLENTLNRVEQD